MTNHAVVTDADRARAESFSRFLGPRHGLAPYELQQLAVEFAHHRQGHEPRDEARPPVKLEDYGPVVDEIAPISKEAWDSLKCQHLYHEPPLAGTPCIKCGVPYEVRT